MTMVQPDSACMDCLPRSTRKATRQPQVNDERGRRRSSSTDKSVMVPCVLARKNQRSEVESKLGYDVDAHRAGGTADGLGSGFDRGGVHVRHLLGGDFEDLLFGHL